LYLVLVEISKLLAPDFAYKGDVAVAEVTWLPIRALPGFSKKFIWDKIKVTSHHHRA
jgi:hypothetical protein